MPQRTVTSKLVTAGLIAVLALPWTAAVAATEAATLDGVIRSDERKPLAAARLLAAHADGSRVFRSEPTGPDGNFSLPDLPPGRYDLAVETPDGVYLVPGPLELVAGTRRAIQIAVAPGSPAPGPQASLWNNPLSAGAIVLGLAIVVGVLVKNATDDELNVSETE